RSPGSRRPARRRERGRTRREPDVAEHASEALPGELRARLGGVSGPHRLVAVRREHPRDEQTDLSIVVDAEDPATGGHRYARVARALPARTASGGTRR